MGCLGWSGPTLGWQGGQATSAEKVPGSASQSCGSGARLEARGDAVGSVSPGWGPVCRWHVFQCPQTAPLGRRVLGTGMGA